METRNQEIKKLEESLKGFLKETVEKTMEKQSERHDKEMQELKEKQEHDISGLRALLLNLQPAERTSSVNAVVTATRTEKELSYLRSIRPKLTKLEFPKFDGDHLYDWLYKCKQFFEVDAGSEFSVGDLVYIKLKPYKQLTVAQRKNHKLSPRYFGPYVIVDRIGAVAYRLQLPVEARIHNVFHISQLKKKVGDQTSTTEWPAFLNEAQDMQKVPVAILERQLVKRFNQAGVRVLVHWSNSSVEEATWEFYDILQRKFPEFCAANP